MPTAPPSSRTVSLSAEATPCFSTGSDSVIAVVDGLMKRPMPTPKHDQAGQHRQVATVDRRPCVASIARPTPNRPTPTSSTRVVPNRFAIIGATDDSGIITTAIGSSPAAAPQRREPEHRLEELDEHQEDAEHHGEHEEQGQRSGGERPVAEQSDVEQRVLVAQLPHDERDRGDDPDEQAGDGERAGPAVLGALVDAEHDAADGERRQERADDVEATGRGPHGCCGRTAHVMTNADDGEHDRHGEQPRPREVVDHERRDEQSEDAAGAGEPGPDADRPGPLLVGEAST